MEKHDPKISADSQVRGMQVREAAVAYAADPRTAPEESSPIEVGHAVRSLFASERDDVFEDGVESEFSRGLECLVRTCGAPALEETARLIEGEHANAEIASEALRWLGHMCDPATYSYRLALLQRSLNSSAASVRDGALLGLSYLKDRKAIPFLAQAIERETIPELREDMQRILTKLERMK